jgi:AAA+ superfamily predicted ATPase
VFLWLIEYYRGVLFMTSNRGEEIDDAIISRATAWVRYELPEPEQLGRIFEVLGDQYGAKFAKGDINRLVNNFQGISGRTVRNLLKLAHMLKGDGFGASDVMEVARYQARENDRTAAQAKGAK